MLQDIGRYTPRILFRLWQKRLLDKNFTATQDEFLMGVDELEYEIKILHARLANIEDKLNVLKQIKRSKYG
jgi:hypothetical protein